LPGIYRDIGFDLPMEHWADRARTKNSRCKYHRSPDVVRKTYDQRQPKTRQRDMQLLSGAMPSADSRNGEAGFDPIIVAPFDAELLGTGGSKDQFSWNNSFATQQTKGIFGSQCRVNI
jgi:hypothetical protein